MALRTLKDLSNEELGELLGLHRDLNGDRAPCAASLSVEAIRACLSNLRHELRTFQARHELGALDLEPLAAAREKVQRGPNKLDVARLFAAFGGYDGPEILGGPPDFLTIGGALRGS